MALASFSPIHQLTDQMLSARARFAPPDVLSIVHDQLLQISKNNNGGLLTLRIVGTIWSASSGMSSVILTLNHRTSHTSLVRHPEINRHVANGVICRLSFECDSHRVAVRRDHAPGRSVYHSSVREG